MYDYCSFADMEVDDFVEASSVLVEPLENFFNEVFVMVVSSSDLILLLTCENFIVLKH